MTMIQLKLNEGLPLSRRIPSEQQKLYMSLKSLLKIESIMRIEVVLSGRTITVVHHKGQH